MSLFLAAFGFMGVTFGRLGASNKKNAAAGGPFLLQTNGTSRILLVNGTDRLLITGTNPAGALSGQPMGLLLSLTYP